MKDGYRFFEREKISYGLRVQQRHARGRIISTCIWENVDHQVQKLISNLEHFKDFWLEYTDVNSCRGQSCIVKW